MWDRILAALSLASLAAFVGVLIWYIAEIDLVIITIGVLILAAIDFYLLTARSRSDQGRSTD
jgi:hypothetical protein